MTYRDGSTVGLCGNGNGGTGAVKAKFNVDLKKILRYIQREKGGAKRPGGKGNLEGDSIAVTHIALKALALTLKEMPIFNGRRVKLPLIGVEGWYPNVGIDVSTTAGRPENGSGSIVKLRDADGMGVGEISKVSGGMLRSSLICGPLRRSRLPTHPLLSLLPSSLSPQEIQSRSGKDENGWIGDAAVPGFLKKPMEVLSEVRLDKMKLTDGSMLPIITNILFSRYAPRPAPLIAATGPTCEGARFGGA